MNENQNPNAMLNGMPPMPQESTNKKGLVLIVLVVILLVILGLMYTLKGSNSSINTDTANVPQESTPIRNEGSLQDPTDAQIQADLDAQLKDVDYSF
jgi:hypothetical protein